MPTVAARREIAFDSATVCDRGLVRAENQDAHCADEAAGLFVVADGMGGGQGGARASAIVAETFRDAAFDGDLPSRLESVRRTIDGANTAIAAAAHEAGYRQMGSTVAALLFGDTLPGEAFAVWVGDSRVYRIRAGTAEAVTNDHTVANELLGMRDGTNGYSRSLPYAHVLTRALGVDARVRSDVRRFETRPGDRLLVCSDGIHDMLSDADIAAIVSSAVSPQAGVVALAEAVRAAGAVDNFTATLVFPNQQAG